MTEDELKAKVAEIPFWFHCINLGNGIITPGWSKTSSPANEQFIGLPENLEGLTVLDIGAFDGFYSFAAERRGASRVLATDDFAWKAGHKKGFNLARQVLDSRVEDKQIDVLEHSPDKIGVFDLVLFLGVLYHMRHPLLALERVASVCKKQLILETHVDMLDCEKPAMAFYPGTELGEDPTSWCGPNPPMVKGMLETVGFQKVEVVSTSSSFLCGSSVSTRMVFHAWR
ncbi:DUF1698 domain-containing protein [Microcoleus sp. F8-D3]